MREQDAAGTGDALRRAYDRYQGACQEAATSKGPHELARLASTRLALVRLLVLTGYEPEPAVLSQVRRDEHALQHHDHDQGRDRPGRRPRQPQLLR